MRHWLYNGNTSFDVADNSFAKQDAIQTSAKNKDVAGEHAAAKKATEDLLAQEKADLEMAKRLAAELNDKPTRAATSAAALDIGKKQPAKAPVKGKNYLDRWVTKTASGSGPLAKSTIPPVSIFRILHFPFRKC